MLGGLVKTADSRSFLEVGRYVHLGGTVGVNTGV